MELPPIPYQEVTFASEGLTLHAWLVPPQKKAIGTIYFLHGNGENISTHTPGIAWIRDLGWNIFALDYRGYGLSEGEPSLEGSIQDVINGYRWLEAASETKNLPIIVYGQSLGGALAISALTRIKNHPKLHGVILDSTFASYWGIARDTLRRSWITFLCAFPCSFLVGNEESPEQKIGQLAPTPLLIIQGEQDVIVPTSHGKRLYLAAKEPKKLLNHNLPGHISGSLDATIRNEIGNFLR